MNKQIDGPQLSIFQNGELLARGLPTDGGASWMVYTPVFDPTRSGTLTSIDPDPVSDAIKTMMAGLGENEYLVDYIGVDPFVAVELWCEGFLTTQHIADAREEDDVIVIENVVLGGRPRGMIIGHAYTEPFQAYDHIGVVVLPK